MTSRSPISQRSSTIRPDLSSSRFLQACRGERTDVVPVWFMRQAGRSLPEYRALRESHDILQICRDPDLAAEVTMQPVRRLGVDAAILFSDIVVPLQAMGIDLDISPGIGPVIHNPIRSVTDVDRLQPLDPAAGVPFVLATIERLAGELTVPLIGFGGAPFTLASYLVEGGPSKNHERTKALMYGEPETWNKLMDRLGEAILTYLRAQIAAGAAAVQIFDSWVGALGPREYEAQVLPAVERIFGGLADLDAPRIYFGINTSELLTLMARSGADVIGVDWRVPLSEARRRTGDGVALQGNLDPSVCFAPRHVVRTKTVEVLEDGGGRGHVFNLGHGVLPDTDPDVLAEIVDVVHEWRPA